ncbi:MAG: four helix bundle protein, partial [Anaerolineae bacterium]|nr:four helix bundle protein [Anaerolineae bacterium]
LEVWKFALDYCDLLYDLSDNLPKNEDFNLKVQIRRAATSVCLNIAEGSTSQTNAEQTRFLGMAIRSLIETVACLRLIDRRNYCPNELILKADQSSNVLAKKLQAFRNSLKTRPKRIGEDSVAYDVSL